MNKLQSKLARLKINSRGYNMKRWSEKIGLANMYNNISLLHFGDKSSLFYLEACHEEERYRRQAAWYLKKQKA